MKISAVTVERHEIKLQTEYSIAGHSFDSVTLFFVRLSTDAGIEGYGSASPAQEVTGETVDLCERALRSTLKEFIVGKTLPGNVDTLSLGALDVVAHAPAACAAIDMAVWDLAAKAANTSIVTLLGGAARKLETSVTIGVADVDETLQEAERYVADGFRLLKLKIGSGVDTDIERIAALRWRFGNRVAIRVDANQGYDLESAIRFAESARPYDVGMLEQPLAVSDVEGARALSGHPAVQKLPLFADESAGSIADSLDAIASGYYDGIVIKLMKCGGISAAMQIARTAYHAGLDVMFGCNDESRLSIAAALQCASAVPGEPLLDLDGHLELASDPVKGGFTRQAGFLTLTPDPPILQR